LCTRKKIPEFDSYSVLILTAPNEDGKDILSYNLGLGFSVSKAYAASVAVKHPMPLPPGDVIVQLPMFAYNSIWSNMNGYA
jgi:hypothetical protein